MPSCIFCLASKPDIHPIMPQIPKRWRFILLDISTNDTNSRKSKTLTWESLLAIPLQSEEMESFIQKKKTEIYEALKPINEKMKARLDEMFSNREVDAIGKINNIHCLQYLMDIYVDWLYKKT